MVWLYLVVFVVSLLGLGFVIREWRRGVRDGIFSALVTFSLGLCFSIFALWWLHGLHRSDGMRLPEALGGEQVARTEDETPPEVLVAVESLRDALREEDEDLAQILDYLKALRSEHEQIRTDGAKSFLWGSVLTAITFVLGQAGILMRSKSR